MRDLTLLSSFESLRHNLLQWKRDKAVRLLAVHSMAWRWVLHHAHFHVLSYKVVQLSAWRNARNKAGSDPTPARCYRLSEHLQAVLRVLLGSSLVLPRPAQVPMEVLLKKSAEGVPDHQCLQLFQTPTHPPPAAAEGQGGSPADALGTPTHLKCLLPSSGQKSPTFRHWAPTTWTLRDGAHLYHVSHVAWDKSVSQGLHALSLKWQ